MGSDSANLSTDLIEREQPVTMPQLQISAEPPPVSDDWNRWPRATLATDADPRRQPRFQTVIRQSALNDIMRHGQSAPEVEICGVLLGNVYRDSHGPLLCVESIIRGEQARGHSSQVTFTSETWSYIHEQLERYHPDKRIAGWYHTHPGHGIFLSGMDLFIQQNFFNLTWQVAYVYDPQGGEDGMFVWQDGQTVRDEYLVDIDEVQLYKPRAKTVDGKAVKSQDPEWQPPAQNWPREPGWWVAPLITLVVSFVLGFIAMAWLYGQNATPSFPPYSGSSQK